MGVPKTEITLELTPRARFDVIDVSGRVSEQRGNLFHRCRKALYYSYHTTAGYFEQSLCERFNHSQDSLRAYVQSFQRMFPPNANYRHDQLHLRSELSEAQRLREPLNGDSHLTFIGCGLANCVTYENRPSMPVYFVDLDGVYRDTTRRRHTTVIGFNRESLACSLDLRVPVSNHPMDSVNLKDSRLGVFEQLQDLIRRHGVVNGRVDLTLDPGERHAGLTVNEYETLLMKHDLVEVLRNPFRFMAEKGKHMLLDPKSVPGKALNYAKYDLVHVANEFIDALGLSESLVERIIDKFLAVPAERFLWMKRSLSLPVASGNAEGPSQIVEGIYQSPVLVQWRKARAQTRTLRARLLRFH